MVIAFIIWRILLKMLVNFKVILKKLQTNGHFTWKLEFVYLLTTNVLQRVFVVLRNWKQKL